MVLSVFGTGQSNAMGRGTGGPYWGAIDGRVKVWNNANPLGANGTAFVSPIEARASHGTFEYLDRNNFGVWFCHQLARQANDDVNFTLVGQGGISITEWAPGAPMLLESIAVWAATGQGPADVFLWHQGESDTAMAPATYIAAFNQLVSDLTAGGVIDASTIIILGGTAEENSGRINFNNNVLKVLADSEPRRRYASSTGLVTYDGTHFDGDSLYVFGAGRYYEAYTGEPAPGTTKKAYGLVNVDGTPGQLGTGQNGLVDFGPYRDIGLGKKSVNDPASFDGTPPLDGMLAGMMLAGGAVVSSGFIPGAGAFMRFESGLQVCIHSGFRAIPAGSLTIRYEWEFPAPFAETMPIPYVGWGPANGGGVEHENIGSNWWRMGFHVIGQSAYSHIRAWLDASVDPEWGNTNRTIVGRAFAVGFWKEALGL